MASEFSSSLQVLQQREGHSPLARKLFELTYRDGSRRHINRAERDSLELAGLLKPTGDKRYLCLIECRTVRMTATENTLSLLAQAVVPVLLLRRRLEGFFIWEAPDGRKTPEYGLETPEAMAERLGANGMARPNS